MPSNPGEAFTIGYHHVGDRVRYEGIEYRVTGHGDPHTGLVYLSGDHPSCDNPGPVHVDNLTLAWCPTAHGGTGRPT